VYERILPIYVGKGVEMSDVDEASVMHEMAHLPGEAVNEGCEY
jgi:hypothetical protein